jgi:HPt (histidine-containing phosphotransfer) domain-containing protein
MKDEKQRRAEKIAAARARMAELATKFVTRSANELVTLRAALARGGRESFEEIGYLAHRMAGTGATLGFDALADHALRIEVIADERQAGALDAATRIEIEAEVAGIEAELKKLRGT